MKKLLPVIVLISFLSNAQQLMVKTNSGMQSFPATKSVSGMMVQGKFSVQEDRSNEMARYIVELSSPLVSQKKSTLLSSQSAVSQRVQVQNAIKSMNSSVRVNREFSEVINGFAISIPRKDLDNIRSINGVKKVYEDVKVTSFPAVISEGTISAVASAQDETGKGVKVGVIDTGIDYLHPSLGGGFGPLYKVAGGYDFVNGDTNPMDDNGHGTHVAGIIAGESDTLHGVAPDVRLYAYKVLDAGGSGNASDVIAGIEQAIKDSVDVINLSLGSPDGNPDDALSTAVDRAVEAGIVVVVAAGNSGNYETINSPGLAQNALTVGAYNAGAVASFSSKGPVSDDYKIKPDVVAPGVSIISAKLGGGYIAMSGTSMATPYVSGIAAALKQRHPDWNGFQIKDAIASHADDLHSSLFAQGNGAVDLHASLASETIISPSSLTFGFDTPSLGSWSKTDTIRIYNSSEHAEIYHCVSPSLNPAVKVTCIPAEIEIPASTEQLVTVSVTVNNSFMANNTDFSDGFTGKIFAYGTRDTIDIPFTFFKGNVLHLQFSETPVQVFMHNRIDFSKSFTPKTSNVSIVVDKGEYDLITAFYGSSYVIKERVVASGISDVAIDKNEAVYKVVVTPSEQNGAPIESRSLEGTYCYLEGILFQPKGYAFISMGGGKLASFPDQVKYFSAMSGDYTYGYSLHLQIRNDSSYTYDISLDSGITHSEDIQFAAADMKKVEMKYDVDPSVTRVFPISWTTFASLSSLISVTFYDGNEAPLTFPFTQTTYYTNRKGAFPFVHSREAYKY